MATILRAADAQFSPQVAAFNFDDVAAEAAECLAPGAGRRRRNRRRRPRARPPTSAGRRPKRDARPRCRSSRKWWPPKWRRRSRRCGQTVAELHHEKQAWISHWETGAVHLAAAIAARVIRRELRQQPEITLALVREALDLAAGSPNVRLHLNPEDYKSLGVQVRTLIDAMSALGDAEVTPDATIGQGGCRVETRFGTIDQQIETQLQRIEEELAA